ncbi:MAG: nitrilase-related carbon-nitrogen hydrolase [Candidatus Krumholzibacteriia bacterium]
MTVLRAAVVQTAPEFGAVAANVAAALSLVPAACDLAVLPELGNTGYQFRDRAELAELAEPVPDGPTCTALRRHAAASGTTLAAGLAEVDGERLFNTAVLVHPDGRVDRYRKVHLFWNEKLIFDPGDLGFPVFAACGTTVGLMICFDWLFPEAAGTLARRGARILCHPSNLVLPHCPRVMPLRALENRIFTLTANRVGHEHRGPEPLRFIGRSVIASPRGEVCASCGPDRVDVAGADLDLDLCDPWLTPRNHVVRDRRPEFYDV